MLRVVSKDMRTSSGAKQFFAIFQQIIQRDAIHALKFLNAEDGKFLQFLRGCESLTIVAIFF